MITAEEALQRIENRLGAFYEEPSIVRREIERLRAELSDLKTLLTCDECREELQKFSEREPSIQAELKRLRESVAEP